MAISFTGFVDLLEQAYGARYAFTRPALVYFVDVIQKQAYNLDLDAFLVWDNYITIYKEVVMDSSGYTPAVEADIDGVVTGGTSGATGVLISYDNDTYTWIINVTSGTFQDGELITAADTGEATSASNANWKGPYEAPANCRKIKGVTRLSDQQLLGSFPYGTEIIQDNNYGFPLFNYNAAEEKYKWVNGRYGMLDNTFTFLTTPQDDVDYRLVYYKNPPDITTEEEGATNFVIPEQHKYTLVFTGVQAIGMNSINSIGQPVPTDILRPALESFWSSYRQVGANTPGANTDARPFI